MGATFVATGNSYPPTWAGEKKSSKYRFIPPDRRPYLTDALVKEHEAMRLGIDCRRAAYWRGVDWRKIGRRFPGILEPFDQEPSKPQQDPPELNCVGAAVATALRLNLAIYRKRDPGQLNPYFITNLARARADQFIASPITGLLESALSAIDQYGTPAGTEKFPATPQILPLIKDQFSEARLNKPQGYANLGNFLGQWSAWLHFEGPIVVQLDVDRVAFKDQVTPESPTIKFNPQARHEMDGTTDVYASHAVVLLGYLPPGFGRFEDSFIVLNSFGNGWGENGIGYIKLEDARQCFVVGYGLTFREQLGYTYEGKRRWFPFLRRVCAPRP